MTPAARARRLLGHLPLVLQGGKNLATLLGVLAAEMTRAEDGVTRLMRSRWYALARGWDNRDAEIDVKVASELGSLAALFGLEPAAGETTEQFRRRLRDVILLHRAGLTSAAAILEMAANVYLPEARPKFTWTDDSTCVADFSVDEPDGPRPVRLAVVDNPKQPARTAGALAPRETLTVRNFGLDAATPEIVLTAPPAADVAVPVLTQVETDLRVIWVGRLRAGDQLTLRHHQLPLVNGRPVSAPVIVVNPYAFDEPSESVFWLAKTIKNKLVTRGARFSVFTRNSELPRLPTGDCNFRFDVLPLDVLARYLAFWPDKDALLTPDLAAPPPPSVGLELRWTEAAAASFALRVPAEYVPWHFKGDQPRLLRALQQVLDEGAAAGVAAHLELVMPGMAEALDVRDAVAVGVAMRDAEALTVDERFRPGGPVITLKDHIAAPEELLRTTGFFDETMFDTSLFAKTGGQ